MEGDAEALGELFVLYQKGIYNFPFRQVGNWAEAEDLTSVVFLEIWRNRSRAIEPGMVRAWTFGVAANVSRNARRSRRRHAAALRRLSFDREMSDFSTASDSRVDDERRWKETAVLLSGLSRRDREVVALCGWAGFSYDEAALALGVPVGTVRSRLSRARARIKSNATNEASAVSGRLRQEGAS
jgi:RNA polymerase sigma-70 factor (ECF subfamily)